MGVIGSVVGNLTDKLSDLGMAIINTFTNPVESIKAIGDTIEDFVIDKVNKLLDGFGLLGSALKKAFSGDFKGALSDAGKGFVLLGDGGHSWTPLTRSGWITKGNVKDLALIQHGKASYIISAVNNGSPDLFKIRH